MKKVFLPIALSGALILAVSVETAAQVTERPRVASPSPTSTSTPTPQPITTPVAAYQSLEQLQSKIRQRIFSMDVRRGRVGVKIVSLNSGRVVFDNDSEKY